MPLIKLERQKRVSDKQFIWNASLPFVDNERGSLIHRVRYGSTYNLHKNPHIGVTFWCGMAVTASDGHLHFLDAPPENKILCERCEVAATKNGLPSSDELAGRHVHKGRAIAIKTCCGSAMRKES